MIKFLPQLILLISLASCSSIDRRPAQAPPQQSVNIESILDEAEASASLSGRKILEESRSMIANQEVIVGGCWDYVNAVYDRVGYSSKDRLTVFKSKFKGPYLKSEPLQAGDWLYFVNYSYSKSEHSAIFVSWIDEKNKIALMISYLGEKQKKPGNYKQFDLKNVYTVIRARD